MRIHSAPSGGRRSNAACAVALCAFAFAGLTPRLAAADSAGRAGGIVDVRLLSDRWLCVVVDTTAEVLAERDRRFGDVLKADKAKHDADPKDWYYPISAKYHTLLVTADLRPRLVRQFESPAYWTVNGKAPEAATYWPQTVDGFPARDPNFPAPAEYVDLPRLADFVYLKLPEPARGGTRLEVRTADGRAAALEVDERASPCWSIKVNQVGYRADAPAKFAYLGMWLGAAGPADFAAFVGRPFQVYTYQPGGRWDEGRAVGEPVFTGTIKLRAKDADQRRDDGRITGEDVYEMDFGAFRRPGRYCVVVPGLGRSWPFDVGDDAYGPAFYTVVRALYQQRCGVELKPPYTAWTRKACHTTTCRGGFPPETDRWYENDKYDPPAADGTARLGFRDAAGRPAKVGSFAAVGATITPEKVAVAGGWHDAADYDRRHYHYQAVWDLCGLYEMFPARFTDGQLNLPESGNGVPDVLDEAAVQVNLFRQTQTPAGGVSGWVEQNRHPHHDEPPDQDTNPFSTSLPERAASYAYAAAAAYLGRLVGPFDAARSKAYVESAAKAYAWASDPKNAIRGVTFNLPKPGGRAGETQAIRFDQPDALPGTQGSKTNADFMLAAVQLYAATREPRYLDDWKGNRGLDEVLLRGQPDAIPPFSFVTPCLHPEWFGADAVEKLTAAAKREADLYAQGQDQLAYRTLWYPPAHGYYPHMAWGHVHAGFKARYPVVCWRVTGDERYRRSVLLALDWEFGCNELGRASATGLGSTHPVCLQHITSERDEWLEPVPGIVPYTYTFGVAYPAWQTQFGLVDAGHPSVAGFFPGAGVCLLPAGMGRDKVQAEMDAVGRNGNWAGAVVDKMRPAVGAGFPVMRRLYTHPTLAPAQDEFTVSESISPLAAVCGAMMADGWKPDEQLKNRRPINDAKALPIYLQP